MRRISTGFRAPLVLAVSALVLSLALPAIGADDNTVFLEMDDEGRFVPTVENRGIGVALADIDSITPPAVSPNGNRVAFSGAIGDESLGQYALFLVDTTGDNLTQLTTGSHGEFDPVWIDDGDTIIVSQNSTSSILRSNCCHLARVDVGTGAVQPITLDVGAMRPAATPSGEFVFFDNIAGVWRMRTVGGTATLIATAGYDAAVSEDETEVAYLAQSGTSTQIRKVGAMGGSATTLYTTNNEIENPVWRDGRIFFLEYGGLGYDGRKFITLRSIPIDGGAWKLERSFSKTVVGVTPGRNGDEVFFYREDGLWRYYDIRPDGTLPSPISEGDNYTRNWTSIASVDLDGDGQDEMFFYRDDGLWRYYDIRPDGTIPSPSSAGDNYTKGWDAITAVDIDGDGQDEMFFYRDDGLYRYYHVRPDGTIPKPLLAGDDYTQGWDSITAIDLDGDGQDEMFFYRDDGLYGYYNVDAFGELGNPIREGSDYDAGISWISAIDLDGDGRDELLFYWSDGSYQYVDVGSTGTLGEVIASGNEYTNGWTIITSIKLGPR